MSKKIRPCNVVVITDLQEKANYKRASLSSNALHTKSDIFMVSEGLRQPKVNLNQSEFKKNPHERKVIKLEKRENTLNETQYLVKSFAPYLVGDSPSNLNITKFHAKDMFKFPADK